MTIVRTSQRCAAVLGALVLFLSCQLWSQEQVASQTSTQSLVSAEMTSASKTSTVPPVTSSQPHDDSFVIGKGDVLAISVWKQPDLSRSVPVRSDGRISLPLIGEVQAAGQTPLKLESDLATMFKPYLAEPEVTVIVEQINSQKFNVLGKVQKPGSYPLVNPTTVLDAIALAGGCRDFAKNKQIYVLRHNPDGTETRLPFNYREVIKGKNTAQNIDLQPHDTVIVP